MKTLQKKRKIGDEINNEEREKMRQSERKK